MHGAAVVPHHEVAGLPLEGPGEVFLGDMGGEFVEQSAAFALVQAYNVLGMVGAEVESLASGFGMGSYQGVGRGSIGVVFGARVGVNDFEMGDAFFACLVERLVGGFEADPGGFAAGEWGFQAVEGGEGTRRVEEAEVGVVVDFRMAESAYGPAAFCEIGDGGDFGDGAWGQGGCGVADG